MSTRARATVAQRGTRRTPAWRKARAQSRIFGIPVYSTMRGYQLYGNPPAWLHATRGVSEIRLALRYRLTTSLLRHFKDTSTLYLEIVDYPGMVTDSPMLAQDYLLVRQMNGLLQGQSR